MARHRRYPVKKKQKIKPGDADPLRESKPTAKHQFNAPPLDADEQPIPHRLKEIREAAKAAKAQPHRKSKKRTKSSFYALTAKSGLKQRPWEDVDMLANRVVRSKNNDIDDELLKARMGMAGRDTKELDADFRLLDEKEERKRTLRKSKRHNT